MTEHGVTQGQVPAEGKWRAHMTRLERLFRMAVQTSVNFIETASLEEQMNFISCNNSVLPVAEAFRLQMRIYQGWDQ